jgi:hypothetical protein
LKSGYTKMRKAHHRGFLIGYDIKLIYQMVSYYRTNGGAASGG